MKVLVFATLFVSFLALSSAVERDEYFFGESADAAVDYYEERDSNSTVVTPINNGTISYNVSTSSGSGDLQINIPFNIDGAYATIEEATNDNPEYQDPTVGTIPGTFLGTSFFFSITLSNGTEMHSMFPKPIQISLYDPDFDVNSDLYLYNTTSLNWESASATCPISSQLKTFVDGTLTVNICHLTQFATFSVAAAVTTGGSPVVISPSASKKSHTTLIIEIVVPIGGAIVITALIIAIVIVYRRNKSNLYDVEMANHKQNVVVSTGSKTPQENRVAEFTRSSVKPGESSSSDDESESELEERNQTKENEESSEEESSSQDSEETSQDSEDSDSTNETNSESE